MALMAPLFLHRGNASAFATNLKPVVSEPGSHCAIDNPGQGDHGVQPGDQDGHHPRRVVQGGLNHMHAGPAEGSRVVTLVMKTVDLPVQKLSHIGHAIDLFEIY